MSRVSENIDGTAKQTVAANAAATASNPTAPAAFTAPVTGSAITVSTNAATDLTTVADALEALRDECATYETAISANIVDIAALIVSFNNLRTALRTNGILA